MDQDHKKALKASLDLAISTKTLVDIMKMQGQTDPLIPQLQGRYDHALSQVVDIIAGDL